MDNIYIVTVDEGYCVRVYLVSGLSEDDVLLAIQEEVGGDIDADINIDKVVWQFTNPIVSNPIQISREVHL